MMEMPCSNGCDKAATCACESRLGFTAADTFAGDMGGLCVNLAAAMRKLADVHGVYLSANAVEFICYLLEQAGDDCKRRQRAVLVVALEEVLSPLATMPNSLKKSIEASPGTIHWIEYGDFRVGVKGNAQKSLILHGNFFCKVLDFMVREIFGPMHVPETGARKQEDKSA